jgi:hypothetical protein
MIFEQGGRMAVADGQSGGVRDLVDKNTNSFVLSKECLFGDLWRINTLPMTPSKAFIFFAAVAVICSSCSKGGGVSGGSSTSSGGGSTGTSGGGTGGGTTTTTTPPPVYTFGSPQTITTDGPDYIPIGGDKSFQLGAVQASVIVTHSQILPNTNSNNVINGVMLYATVDLNGVSNIYGARVLESFNPNSVAVACFGTDSAGAFLYMVDAEGTGTPDDQVSEHALYQMTIGSPQTATATRIVQGLGFTHCLKVNSSGMVVVSSDSLGGSLLSVNPGTGAITVIASQLGSFPGAFDVYNGNYYVVINGTTSSSVVKVSNGTASPVLGNLASASNICFDKDGNFILATDTTINDGTPEDIFIHMGIYTPSGTFIQPVTDGTGTPIQTSVYYSEFGPFYVDQYNNLYFSTVETESFTICNPAVNYTIYKLSMTK